MRVVSVCAVEGVSDAAFRVAGRQRRGRTGVPAATDARPGGGRCGAAARDSMWALGRTARPGPGAVVRLCRDGCRSRLVRPGGPAFAASADGRRPVLAAARARYACYAVALASYADSLDRLSVRIALLRREIEDRLPVGLAAVTSSAVPGWTGGVAVAMASPGHAAAPDDPVLRGLTWQFKTSWDEWADALDRCCAGLRTADHDDRVARDAHGWSAGPANSTTQFAMSHRCST